MKKYLIPILSVLLAIVFALAVYFYLESKKVVSTQTNTQNSELSILPKVAKLILLPEGETPTIATVSDLEKLKGQAFFAKAKVGDKVIIYAQARKAFLYDPIANKILEVAPIDIPNPTPTQTQTQTQAKTPAAPVTSVTPAKLKK